MHTFKEFARCLRAPYHMKVSSQTLAPYMFQLICAYISTHVFVDKECLLHSDAKWVPLYFCLRQYQTQNFVDEWPDTRENVGQKPEWAVHRSHCDYTVQWNPLPQMIDDRGSCVAQTDGGRVHTLLKSLHFGRELKHICRSRKRWLVGVVELLCSS